MTTNKINDPVDPSQTTPGNLTTPAPPSSSSLTLDFDYWNNLSLSKDFTTLTKEFIRAFDYFLNHTIIEENPQIITCINRLLGFFFVTITQNEFVIPPEEALRFIRLNQLIANLTRISHFYNTDATLVHLLQKPNNLLKILSLYNSYCNLQLDIKPLFDSNPAWVMEWLMAYSSSPSYLSKNPYENQQRFYEAITSPAITFSPQLVNISLPYFKVTYVAPNYEAALKNKFNQLFKDVVKPVLALSKNGKPKIAVCSGKWFKGAAVYKCLYSSVASLFDKEAFELTLINTRNDQLTDTTGFDEVIPCYFTETGLLNGTMLGSRKFDLVFYPDVGMTNESVLLSTKRLAPIQICSYGHPASTANSEIDYWFGGQLVEKPEQAKDYYHERLVLLPGLALQSLIPDYQRSYPVKTTNAIIVSCPWGFIKVTYPLVMSLKRVLERVDRPVVFRFFPNWGLNNANNFLPWKKDMEEALGAEHVEVIQDNGYAAYMEKIEETDFGIDSYPFGGFNTAIDVLYLQKPIIGFEGDFAHARFCSGVLRILQLDELIAYSWQEYEDLIVRLIVDDQYRQQLSDSLTEEKFHSMIQRTCEPSAFRRAVEYLLANHEQLEQDNSRDPIVIN